MQRLKRIARWSVVILAVALLAIQFVPVDRQNPPVESDFAPSPELAAVLRRSCYDCHSHETRWPWYSRVAPVSWLVAKDVREARRELNFSAWDRLDGEKQGKAAREAWEEVEEGKMPLWFYLPLHPEARLTDADRALLRAWSQGSDGRSSPRD